VHHHWQYSLLCACSCSKFPIAPMGKLLTGLHRLSLAQLRPTLRSTTASTCRRDLQLSHRPNGKIADMLALTRLRSAQLHLATYAWPRPYPNYPNAPMGDSCFAHCLQGGGVYVSSGTVTITSSSITGNTALYVRAHVQKFPSPRWEDC